MSNILKLANPSLWYCEVTHLARGHGELVIKLMNKKIQDEYRELQFVHVNYFSGWTAWKGADFRFGTDVEYVKLIRQATERFQKLSDEEILETPPFDYNRLFICKTEYGDLIYFVADGGRILDTNRTVLTEF